ncbi:cardiotrophin-like cytokine factor 1 isoform X2 [Manis pentadactyla]|uniref:cardiotrophin-like cytokine factor 1 isoform X2 n=1 Tax=Manis pentadactyla TaxID=143292 RepID=UPI001873E0B6|nr:cardiotrophin-like cytokine factor 1 isoform X2 [Manis pentadactyla]
MPSALSLLATQASRKLRWVPVLTPEPQVSLPEVLSVLLPEIWGHLAQSGSSPNRGVLEVTQLDIQVEGSPGFCAEEKDLELSWDVKNSEQKVTQRDSWGMLACLCTVLWHLPAVPALNRTGDPGPGPSIQKTYDLTRYLEHQLRSLAGTYLNYLGPPFNEPDFNPPRLGAETLPRATVNLDVWRSLNDKLRLTQNYEAYSHLLCYLRGLNRQAATAELRRSLAHFCTSLQGLLGSIAGVMAALGYPLPQPLPGTEPTWAPGPAHSDFLQKMDDFWLLKELQTWLWRSAKDFNRLKKKMQPRAAAVTLHLKAHGF